MSTLIFHAKHETDFNQTDEYDGTAGEIEWIAQGLNGSCGAMQVTPSASEASAYKDIPANAENDFSVQLYLARRTSFLPSLGSSRTILQILRDSGAQVKVSLKLYYDGADYYCFVDGTDDGGNTITSSIAALGDVWPAYIELRLKKSTTDSAENGSIVIEFPSGTQTGITQKILFDEFDFDRVKVGCMSTTVSDRGYFVIDEVRVMANDTGFFLIGPLGEPPHPPTLKSQGHAKKTLLYGRSGDVWEVDLSNDGLPCVRYPRYAAAGSARAFDAIPRKRCQLFDSEHTGVWRIQVDDSTPHAPQLEAYALGANGGMSFEDLSIFSHNAREWAITVNSSGTMIFTAQTSVWPVLGQPIIPITGEPGRWARFDITDGGSIFLTEITVTPYERIPILRQQDNGGAFAISAHRSLGVLEPGVTGTTALSTSNIFYDFEVVSAGGIVWRVQIPDENGTLTPWSVTAFEQSRQSHTVAIDSRGKIVVIDPRFKTAHQRKTGWGGRTFRGGRA